MHRDRFAYDIIAVVLEVDLVSGSAIAMGQLFLDKKCKQKNKAKKQQQKRNNENNIDAAFLLERQQQLRLCKTKHSPATVGELGWISVYIATLTHL